MVESTLHCWLLKVEGLGGFQEVPNSTPPFHTSSSSYCCSIERRKGTDSQRQPTMDEVPH